MPSTHNDDYIAAYCGMEQRTTFQLLTQRHMPTVSVSELLRCNKQNRIPSGAYFRVVGVVTIVEGGYLGDAGGDDDEATNDIGNRGEPKLFVIDPSPRTISTATASCSPVAPTSQVGRSSQSAIRQTIVKSEPIHDDDYHNHGEDSEGNDDEEASDGPLYMCEVDCMSSIQRKVSQLLKTMPVPSQQQHLEVAQSPPSGGGAEQLQYSLYDEDDPRGGDGSCAAEMEQQPISTVLQQPLSTTSLFGGNLFLY